MATKDAIHGAIRDRETIEFRKELAKAAEEDRKKKLINKKSKKQKK